MSIVSVSYSAEEKSLIPLVILGPAQCDNRSCHLPHAPVTQQLFPLDLAYPPPHIPLFRCRTGHGRPYTKSERELEQKRGQIQINTCFNAMAAYLLKYFRLQTLSKDPGSRWFQKKPLQRDPFQSETSSEKTVFPP